MEIADFFDNFKLKYRWNMKREYRICSRCIMDTSDPDIEFDENGVCNHCMTYDKIIKERLLPSPEREKRLEEIIIRMKKNGKNKTYDCIIGLSGGLDSSYVAYLANKLGLRLLGVHLDNGWNSEVSVKNIENIVKKLEIDLYTCVIDWEEFKDLQRSFFKASVVDIEMLTDHAIIALLYRLADEKKIKYILSGCNIVTEAIMPKSWFHRKSDLRNIKAIQKKFGTRKIKTLPTASTFEINFYRFIKGIKTVYLLNYITYAKDEAIATLGKELGWKHYGLKHCESIFTKFYQNYILPVKFNIDKRRAHYSNLICSGQMTREEALKVIAEDSYPSAELAKDKEYVLKKLDFSEGEFEEIMELPIKSHCNYATDQILYNAMTKIKRLLKNTIKINW